MNIGNLTANWKNIAAFLTGASGLVVTIGGVVPSVLATFGLDVDPVMAEHVVGGLSGALLTLAGRFGDSDGDGIPNLVDSTPQGAA